MWACLRIKLYLITALIYDLHVCSFSKKYIININTDWHDLSRSLVFTISLSKQNWYIKQNIECSFIREIMKTKIAILAHVIILLCSVQQIANTAIYRL